MNARELLDVDPRQLEVRLAPWVRVVLFAELLVAWLTGRPPNWMRMRRVAIAAVRVRLRSEIGARG